MSELDCKLGYGEWTGRCCCTYVAEQACTSLAVWTFKVHIQHCRQLVWFLHCNRLQINDHHHVTSLRTNLLAMSRDSSAYIPGYCNLYLKISTLILDRRLKWSNNGPRSGTPGGLPYHPVPSPLLQNQLWKRQSVRPRDIFGNHQKLGQLVVDSLLPSISFGPWHHECWKLHQHSLSWLLHVQNSTGRGGTRKQDSNYIHPWGGEGRGAHVELTM